MELGPFINKVADWFGESSVIATIFDNPIYVAIAMTIIIIVILYMSARDTLARPAVKIFAALLAMMFIYHRRFEKRYDREKRATDIASSLSAPSTIVGATDVSVIP